MNITIEQTNGPFDFEARNESGAVFPITASEKVGGSGKGFRPMQLLVAGLGGCSSIDVIKILQKQQQVVEGYRVELQAERHEDKVPATFKSITVHFVLKGDLSPKKVERAISLSLEKYCSVAKILEPTCTINYDFKIL
ncbi:MAG: OsmC family protein [Balneolaceae bacterium]|nr:OsmC family protein [Balneolaceae bacterium]